MAINGEHILQCLTGLAGMRHDGPHTAGHLEPAGVDDPDVAEHERGGARESQGETVREHPNVP